MQMLADGIQRQQRLFFAAAFQISPQLCTIDELVRRKTALQSHSDMDWTL